MRIILVSYNFLPSNNSEAIQTARLVKYLSAHDVNIDVVTSATNLKADQDIPVFNERVQVHYTDDKYYHYFSNKYITKIFNVFPLNQVFPDVFFGWINPAVKKISELIDGNQAKEELIIYSRAFPPSSNLAALKIAKRYNLRWIAHFSDPWMSSASTITYSLPFSYNKKLESEIFMRTNAVTVASKGILNFYNNQYPNAKIKQLDHIACKEHIWEPELPSKKNNKIVVCHTGAFYKKIRNPERFISVLSYIRNHINADIFNQIEVQFIGNHIESYRKMMVEIGAENSIVSIPRISYKDSITYMLQSDILLLIDTHFKDPKNNMFMPSKITDYLSADKPIIYMTSFGSDIYNVLEKNKQHLFIDNEESVSSAAEKIDNFIERLPMSDSGNESITCFDGIQAAEELLRIIEKC